MERLLQCSSSGVSLQEMTRSRALSLLRWSDFRQLICRDVLLRRLCGLCIGSHLSPQWDNSQLNGGFYRGQQAPQLMRPSMLLIWRSNLEALLAHVSTSKPSNISARTSDRTGRADSSGTSRG